MVEVDGESSNERRAPSPTEANLFRKLSNTSPYSRGSNVTDRVHESLEAEIRTCAWARGVS